MSAYTSLYFSREEAISKINHVISQPHIENNKLERILDILLEDQLYNAIVSEFIDEIRREIGY